MTIPVDLAKPITGSMFVAGLRSPDIEVRLHACLRVEELGTEGLELAGGLLRTDPEVITRVWALQSVARFASSAPAAVGALALVALRDSAPSVRSATLILLGSLKNKAAVTAIAQLLSDHSEDPLAWDEPSTVSASAVQALEAIGTEQALAALESYRKAGASGA